MLKQSLWERWYETWFTLKSFCSSAIYLYRGYLRIFAYEVFQQARFRFYMYNIDLCSYIQKRGLENSLNDAKHWHDIELQNLGSVIGKLEAELADVRGDIEQQQRDYETLLNNKKRLEMEIGMYHGILDGEENRFHPSM